MSEGRGGLAGLAVALGAAGLAAGLFAERRLVGRQVEGRAPDGEPLGLFRGRPQPVTADDGVELWAEIDDPRPGAEFADLTVVFSHGYSLNLDAFHFQRKGLGGSARLVFWDQRGHGRSGRSPRLTGAPSRSSATTSARSSTRRHPTGRSCSSATRWAA